MQKQFLAIFLFHVPEALSLLTTIRADRITQSKSDEHFGPERYC